MKLIRTYKKWASALALYSLLVFTGLIFQVHICKGPPAQASTELTELCTEEAQVPLCCVPGTSCLPDCCTERTIVVKADTDEVPAPVLEKETIELPVQVLYSMDLAFKTAAISAFGKYLPTQDPPPLLKQDVQSLFQVFLC